MNELELVLAWLASVAGGADCGICNAINNGFDNLLGLGIGVAGAAGAAAGTVVSGATSAGNRIGDAARDARDAFNANYDRASGGSDSSTTPPASSQVEGQFPSVSRPPQVEGQFPSVQGPFGPVPAPNPWSRAFSGQAQNPNAPSLGGTLNYFNVDAPTGSQLGGPQ